MFLKMNSPYMYNIKKICKKMYYTKEHKRHLKENFCFLIYKMGHRLLCRKKKKKKLFILYKEFLFKLQFVIINGYICTWF